MLLRRVIGHVKAQNWLAVGIEFLIVVVGVFLGIQASNWNDAQAERSLEKQYYTEIIMDLDADLAMAERTLEMADRHDAYAKYMLKAINDPGFEIEAPGYLGLAVVRAGYARLPRVSRRTYDELISTGNLRLLRNTELKRAISAYYENAALIRQWDILQRDMQSEYRSIAKGLAPRPAMRSALYEEEADLSIEDAGKIIDAARARDGLADMLIVMATVQARARRDAENIKEDAEALAALLTQELER